MKQPRIEVGKENCMNDIPIYLGRTLPEIKDKLNHAFYEKDYKAMAEQIERLKRVTKDFDDMIHELSKG